MTLAELTLIMTSPLDSPARTAEGLKVEPKTEVKSVVLPPRGNSGNKPVMSVTFGVEVMLLELLEELLELTVFEPDEIVCPVLIE